MDRGKVRVCMGGGEARCETRRILRFSFFSRLLSLFPFFSSFPPNCFARARSFRKDKQRKKRCVCVYTRVCTIYIYTLYRYIHIHIVVVVFPFFPVSSYHRKHTHAHEHTRTHTYKGAGDVKLVRQKNEVANTQKKKIHEGKENARKRNLHGDGKRQENIRRNEAKRKKHRRDNMSGGKGASIESYERNSNKRGEEKKSTHTHASERERESGGARE